MERNETGCPERDGRRGAVLLTGATGFVGGELLRRLIAHDPRSIVCLVRAESNSEATARGLGALAATLGRAPTPHEQERVTWLAGDLTQSGLGLHSDRWWQLAESLEEVFHCAASTRFDLPLEEAQLANVRGVEEIYELACAAVDAGRFRRLNHVSTAYASGRTSTHVDADHLPPDRASAFRNTYERTKARAERMLRTQSRVPYTIYRPSIIVGDSRDGHTSSWNVVYFPMRLMASAQLPFAPRGGRALLDCVPIDYVADAVLALAGRRDTVNRAFHLTSGEEAMTVDQVVRQTYEGLARRRQAEVRGRTRLLGPISWWAFTTANRLLRGPQVRRALERFEQYTLYTRVSSIFDCRTERGLLARHGVHLPRPDEFFPRIVDYALRHDFGRRPAPTPHDPGRGTAEAAVMGGLAS